RRTSPDVAYDAAPGTGVAVYSAVTYDGNTGWFKVGGTSAGAPQWAALIALLDQGRAAAGHGSLDGFRQTLPATYHSLPSGDFHDIVSGTAGGNAAGPGYDLVTGLGSPYADRVVYHLGSVPFLHPFGSSTTTTSKMATASSMFSDQVSPSASNVELPARMV